MKTDEKTIAKVNELISCIENVLAKPDSQKFSYVWLSKNKNNLPELSARAHGNKELVTDLGETSYTKFCKAFFDAIIDNFLTSETIGFSPKMGKQYEDGADTWIGYPLYIENVETGKVVNVCFTTNNEAEAVVDYFETQCVEKMSALSRQ